MIIHKQTLIKIKDKLENNIKLSKDETSYLIELIKDIYSKEREKELIDNE